MTVPPIIALVITQDEPITSVVVNGQTLVPILPFVYPLGADGSGGIFSVTPPVTPYLNSISISPSSLNIDDALEHSLTVNGLDQNSNPITITGIPTWTSTNGNVPVTTGGDVSALQGSQTSTVEVSIPNGGPAGLTVLTASITVTSSASAAQSVTLLPNPLSVIIAGTGQLTPTAIDQFNHSLSTTFTYLSSNTNVATVNSSGLVTGVGSYIPVGVSVNPNYAGEANYDLNWEFMKATGVGTSEITFVWKYLIPDSSNLSATTTSITPVFTATDVEVAKAYAQGTKWGPYFINGADIAPTAWATRLITSDASARQVMSTLATAIWGRYHSAGGFGDFAFINVVNEALLGGAYQANIFYNNYTSPTNFSTGYIADALLKVHAASPTSILQLNFGHTEYDTTQQTAITTLVAGLHAAGTLAGITLDIGCEWHLTSDSGNVLSSWLTWANSLWTTYGVSVSITEMDYTDHAEELEWTSFSTGGTLNCAAQIKGANVLTLSPSSGTLTGTLFAGSKLTIANQVFTIQNTVSVSGGSVTCQVSPALAAAIVANSPVTLYQGVASTLAARQAGKQAVLLDAFAILQQVTKLRFCRFWQLDFSDSWIVKNALFPREDGLVQDPCLTYNYSSEPGWVAFTQYWPQFPANPADMRTMALLGGGTCTVTATASNSTTGTATVNVQEEPVLASLNVSPLSATITGTNVTLALVVNGFDQYDKPYPNPPFACTSSSNSIATVQNNGLITSQAVGTCIITLTGLTGDTPTVTVTVTVVPKPTQPNTNQPAGSTTVVETGHITVLPVTGTKYGLSSFSMFSPSTQNPTTGEWSGNLTLVPSPGTGLRITYPPIPGISGNAPVNFGFGYGGTYGGPNQALAGTGTIYIGMLMQFMAGFYPPYNSASNPYPNGIKLFEPRTWTQGNGGPGPATANHITPITFTYTATPPGLNHGSLNSQPGFLFPGTFLQGGQNAGQSRLLQENQSTGINIADGDQHFVEYILVQDNPVGGSNGKMSMWIDGTVQALYTNCNYLSVGNIAGWPYFLCQPVFGGGGSPPAFPQYWDFDQLVVATL